MTPEPPPMALEGIKVLDLASLYAGPLIATNLGDYGADVIKVEHPRGDDARRWGLSKNGVPLWWKSIARNKRLITLDLHDEEDRQTVRELAQWADIVIENFRPGRLESWGLGWADLHALNPRLILVRVTGFGQTGPLAQEPGFGTLAEAFSGFAAITGQPDGPPTLPPFGLADGVAALAGTYAAMMALYWRDAQGGGVGQMIDLSLYEPLFGILGPQAIEYLQTGTVQQRQGNRSKRTAPRNAYRTADNHWVALSGGTQQIVNRMLTVIGRPELAGDERFSTAAARLRNADEIDTLIGDWIAAHPLDEVLARFRAVEAPIAPIYDIAQIVRDPHYQARGTIASVPDPDLGEAAMTAVYPRLSRTPGQIRFAGARDIGAHQGEVLAEISGRKAGDTPVQPASGAGDRS
ncbi:CoA transferase (plasmid) [Deinococcus metallilatus]|uniref:CoA transferase n=1 Tax=Deinococcus metallilatus TaxID=1211322 RepID=A0AAJ5F5Z6_9DEIO|nr:CoA transferase [Deinococcus metallilatus]MBB5293462.1 crotonobetainyl-CoA:carnitine CoA-transferase CaiB-like acyl-CoA transferase [Deinococcus metallilatus]QBY06547.1 CoA transferase [Deinococcus metallilatus]RXJ17890.1 CoA transferase [Deinococcus metallilatus]TLK32162.1 CoA transferase [Deinococcus metallilatus]GMA15318.1 CoA transferase [Deinococcus metallilatus]